MTTSPALLSSFGIFVGFFYPRRLQPGKPRKLRREKSPGMVVVGAVVSAYEEREAFFFLFRLSNIQRRRGIGHGSLVLP